MFGATMWRRGDRRRYRSMMYSCLVISMLRQSHAHLMTQCTHRGNIGVPHDVVCNLEPVQVLGKTRTKKHALITHNMR